MTCPVLTNRVHIVWCVLCVCVCVCVCVSADVLMVCPPPKKNIQAQGNVFRMFMHVYTVYMCMWIQM